MKKNDSVKVTAGNSKGAVGKVLFIDRAKGSVIVEGVNIMHKHTSRVRRISRGDCKKGSPDQDQQCNADMS
ncbi:MAG: KOW motif domain-containing protein [Ignavibacteria bacterium]